MAKVPFSSPKIVNKKVRYEFELLETVEAGIALTGSEVKSLRMGKASLDGAFAYIRNSEVFLRDCTISPYPMASYKPHQPGRERKLLLHRRQIRKWQSKVTLRGLTMVPLSIYFNDRGIAKVEVALARGKTHSDKRQTIKKRQQERDAQQDLRRRR